MLAALLNRNEGWKVRVRHQSGTYTTVSSSEKIYFNGANFGDPIATDSFQNSTHLSDSTDIHICGSPLDGIAGTMLPEIMPESTGTLIQVVSPTGNDTTGNGTVGNPWRTINRAWTNASLGPGGIIYLRGNSGEHGNLAGTGEATSITVTARFGSPTNPITMETYPGDPRAVINGTRLHLNPGDLRQNDYNSGQGFNVRIRNLEFKGAIGFGVNAIEAIKTNNARNFEISNCKFHDVGSSSIVVRGMGREQVLVGAIDATQTTIQVDATTNLLNATPYYIGVTNVTGANIGFDQVTEIMRVTNVAGTTLTVERGARGTPNVSHINGARLTGFWQCDNVQIFNNEIYESATQGTTVDGAQSISSGATLTVASTAIFPTTGSLNNTALVVAGVPVALPYTSKTATTFTLGTFSGSYSVANGAKVLNSWAAQHAHGIYYGSDCGATNGAIYNNLIYRNAAFGITMHEEANGTIVVNNTVHENGRGGINMAGENTHGTRDCIIKNNCVTNNLMRSPLAGAIQQGFAFNVWYASTIGEWDDVNIANNIVDRNLHSGNQNATLGGYHTTNTTDWPSGSVVFSNDVNADPLYTNSLNGIFTLQLGSPAYGIGDAAYTPELDFNGNPRHVATVGAFRSAEEELAVSADHILNVEYASPTQALVAGSLVSLPLIVTQCPILLSLHFLEEVQTTNAKFFSHGATDDIGLTNADIKATYAGGTVWTSINGMAQALVLPDHASDLIHEWPIAVSYSPTAGGTSTGSIKITLSFI